MSSGTPDTLQTIDTEFNVSNDRKQLYKDLLNEKPMDNQSSDDDYNPSDDDAMIDDSEGYDSNEEVYQKLQKKDKKKFYKTGESHWDTQKPVIHDMVGGDDIHDYDIRGSQKFLDMLKLKHKKQYSLDVGSGIGRVSKYLLKEYAVKDLVERSEVFLGEAQKLLSDNTDGQYINTSLEGLIKQPWYLTRTYQIIWIQWVLMYLMDDDVVGLLELLGQHLAEDGVLVIRESCCPASHRLLFDHEDSSTTRSDVEWKRIFSRVNTLKLTKEKVQRMPDHYFPGKYYAFEARTRTNRVGK